jgi:hypothetical protein
VVVGGTVVVVVVVGDTVVVVVVVGGRGFAVVVVEATVGVVMGREVVVVVVVRAAVVVVMGPEVVVVAAPVVFLVGVLRVASNRPTNNEFTDAALGFAGMVVVVAVVGRDTAVVVVEAVLGAVMTFGAVDEVGPLPDRSVSFCTNPTYMSPTVTPSVTTIRSTAKARRVRARSRRDRW